MQTLAARLLPHADAISKWPKSWIVVFGRQLQMMAVDCYSYALFNVSQPMNATGEGMSCALGKLSFSSVPCGRSACSRRVFETRTAVSHRQPFAACRASMTEVTKKGATFEETALGMSRVALFGKVLIALYSAQPSPMNGIYGSREQRLRSTSVSMDHCCAFAWLPRDGALLQVAFCRTTMSALTLHATPQQVAQPELCCTLHPSMARTAVGIWAMPPMLSWTG